MKVTGEGGGYREEGRECIIKLYTLIDLRAENNSA